jgi:hypothetical protein
MTAPTFTLVPAAELRPGQMIQWPGGPFHPAGMATVRRVTDSSWAGGDWTRVLLCGPAGWVESSGRHRWAVVNVDG